MRWRWPGPLTDRAAALALLAAAPVAAAAEALDCVIEPGLVVQLGSPVSGVLAAVPVARGEAVAEGDVVARIESSVEEATVALLRLRAADRSAVAAQEARLALAVARMQRADLLLARRAIAADAHEEIAAELAVARAELERTRVAVALAEQEWARAEAQLALHRVRSPIDGVVTARLLSAGEFVFQDRHVLEIARLDPLHVEVFPPLDLFGQLRIGQTALVRPALPDAGPLPATVTVIDRVFDATSNTFGVRLEIANPDARLPAGLRCSVTFEHEPDH